MKDLNKMVEEEIRFVGGFNKWSESAKELNRVIIKKHLSRIKIDEIKSINLSVNNKLNEKLEDLYEYHLCIIFKDGYGTMISMGLYH